MGKPFPHPRFAVIGPEDDGPRITPGCDSKAACVSL